MKAATWSILQQCWKLFTAQREHVDLLCVLWCIIQEVLHGFALPLERQYIFGLIKYIGIFIKLIRRTLLLVLKLIQGLFGTKFWTKCGVPKISPKYVQISYFHGSVEENGQSVAWEQREQGEGKGLRGQRASGCYQLMVGMLKFTGGYK